jgi:hypothetical protein
VPLNADIVEASITEIHQLSVRAGATRPIGETLLHVAPRQRAARMNGLGVFGEDAHGFLQGVTCYGSM